MAERRTFQVTVQRISYSDLVTIEVQAKDAEEASRNAKEAAGNICFGEESAEYSIEDVRKV